MTRVGRERSYPLTECNQRFTSMDLQLRRSLHEHLHLIAGHFGLDSLFFLSFGASHTYGQLRASPHREYWRRRGHARLTLRAAGAATAVRDTVMASDVVYAAAACLESTQRTGQPGPSASAASDAAGTAFFHALDAVATGGRLREPLQRGLDLAIAQQVALVQHLCSIATRRSIINVGSFYYTRLPDTQQADYFVHPLMLRRLAHALADMVRVHVRQDRNSALVAGGAQGNRPKPLIVLAPRIATSSYLVLGVPVTERFGDTRPKCALRRRRRRCRWRGLMPRRGRVQSVPYPFAASSGRL